MAWWPRLRRLAANRKIAVCAAFVSQFSLLILAGFLLIETAIRLTPLPDMAKLDDRSTLVVAADQSVLWGFLSSDDKWRLQVDAESVDDVFVDLLKTYEDKRFASHAGVDPVALLRAGFQAIRQGEIVSGGSTLTMQLVRLLEPKPRTLDAKRDQILKAMRLERSFGKGELLRMYLSIAPYGSNIEGVRAASQIYFGIDPQRLTLAQSALLIALPQSPETRRPDLYPTDAKRARNQVLARLARRGLLAAQQVAAASAQPLGVRIRQLPRNAPHVARRLVDGSDHEGRDTIVTTINARLQRQVETIARQALRQWSRQVNVAVVVMRNRDGAIVAYSGGSDLHMASRKGHVDLGRSVRSPGSALKPFIYALAFEELAVHPDTIIVDEPLNFDGYAPQNALLSFTGELPVRQALIQSINTTAVALLDRIGIDRLLLRLESVGVPLRLPGNAGKAGLAVALGGAGVTLSELTWLYSSFPSEGMLMRPRLLKGEPVVKMGRVFDREAALAIADILADMPPPTGFARRLTVDGGRRIGYKTGTSFGFRDAWSIGFDEHHTVGVWLGKPDGAAHLGSYGGTAAAPVMMRVFDQLPNPQRDLLFERQPQGALESPRKLPQRLARFTPLPAAHRPPSLEITFPTDNSQIVVGRNAGVARQLQVSVRGGQAPYRWVVAGRAGEPDPSRQLAIDVPGRGQQTISVIDASGSVAKASFWVEFED